MSTIRIEHLARVEGHGGITVELDGSSVKRVEFEIFESLRLLETLVRGLDCERVSPALSRICAICSVAHALTSLKATEAALGIQVTPRTVQLRELLFRGENIQSHALHFFFLALPDYLGYASVLQLAQHRRATVELGLRLKKLGNTIQETIGGRAVHPVNAVLGGFAKLPTAEQLIALRRALEQGRQDVDLAVELASKLPSIRVGSKPTAYAAASGGTDYGYYVADRAVLLRDGEQLVFPASEYTRLTNEQPVAHSHARYSSFDGQPFMVGALARLSIHQHKLGKRAKEALAQLGLDLPSSDPLDNNKAQVVEMVEDVDYALRLVDELLDKGLSAEPPATVERRAGQATAITEAPRGLLVHSYSYDDHGRLLAADVITPTAINAASIEDRFRAVVAAAEGSRTAELAHSLAMVARAYDPCLSCSVHVIEASDVR